MISETYSLLRHTLLKMPSAGRESKHKEINKYTFKY